MTIHSAVRLSRTFRSTSSASLLSFVALQPLDNPNYRVFRKNCVFFIIHCNSSLAYIALQEFFKAFNAMRVNSHSYWMLANICTTIVAQCWRGRGGKIMKILGKSTISTEHPVFLITKILLIIANIPIQVILFNIRSDTHKKTIC